MNRKKILIIEDDISIKDNLSDLLEINGFKVFSAVDGHDGFELAKEIIPDLILCDVMMPKMDGFKVKEKITADKKLTMVPFIFLTAKTDHSSFRKGMNLGADDYITKPFENRDLIAAINLRLKKYEELQKISKQKSRKTDHKGKSVIDKILLNVGESKKIITISEIVFLKSMGNYSQVCLKTLDKITVRRTLKEWETLLSQSEFFRIHQSYIINLNYVKKIEHFSKHSFIAKMSFYEEALPISARYAKKLHTNFLI